jgi:hypothetical protein
MTATYHYRNKRLEVIQAALDKLGDPAALAPEQTVLRDRLVSEFEVLKQDHWQVSDAAYFATTVESLTGMKRPQEVQELVAKDPVHFLFNEKPITPNQASQVFQNIWDFKQSSQPSEQLLIAKIYSTFGRWQAPRGLEILVHACHSRWLASAAPARRYLFDDVGVILPIRIETLFDPPSSQYNTDLSRYQLSVRVTPDDASVCNDPLLLSRQEQVYLVSFWKSVQGSQNGPLNANWFDTDGASEAWAELERKVGPKRAAWMISSIHPEFSPEGDVSIPKEIVSETDHPRRSRISGLPPELKVYLVYKDDQGEQQSIEVGRLPQDPNKKLDASELKMALPDEIPFMPEESATDPNDGSTRRKKEYWWSSWSKAIEVGLGGQWFLPQGVTPENIESLYVVGIGEQSAQEHFVSHALSGDLSIIPLGTPTNSIKGKTKIGIPSLDANWFQIAKERLKQRLVKTTLDPSKAGGRIAKVLTETGLPFFPGADFNDQTYESHRMVSALWPALWGHWLRDFWGLGERADLTALWAMNNLYPEGPLMPIRIGDQPYGIIPATAISRWKRDSIDDEGTRAIEVGMANNLTMLRGAWAQSVQENRSVVGKSIEEFMEILGQDALSRRLVARGALGVQGLFELGQTNQSDKADIINQIRSKLSAVEDVMQGKLNESKFHGFVDRVTNIELPLVQPTKMPFSHLFKAKRERLPIQWLMEKLLDYPSDNSIDSLEEFFQISFFGPTPNHNDFDFNISILPDSLLIRLMTYACQLASELNFKESPRGSKAHLLQKQRSAVTELAQVLDNKQWQRQEQALVKDKLVDWKFWIEIPDKERTDLERALRATLDTAAHRIDPWITGLAWSRLERSSNSQRRVHRMGLYGWLDGPFVGKPGPNDSGLLLTPSRDQTLTALILRDKFLTAKHLRQTSSLNTIPWHMNVTSSKVQLAEEILEEVKRGIPIQEVLGRRIEDVVSFDDADRNKLETLRKIRFPMNPGRNDPNEVCNGSAALVDLVNNPQDDLFSTDPQKSSNQIKMLRRLQDAMDVMSDMLVAQGVLSVVRGDIAHAAKAMDASSGFDKPPSLEVIQTPSSGFYIKSNVLSVLPFFSVTSLSQDSSPLTTIEPSFAKFLESKLGANWSWTVRKQTDQGITTSTVGLEKLGLSPIDTLGYSDEFLSDWVLAVHRSPVESVDANTKWTVESEQVRLARQLASTLGCRLAMSKDILCEKSLEKNNRTESASELFKRYKKIRERLSKVIEELSSGISSQNPDGLKEGLRQSILWGAIPEEQTARALAFRFMSDPSSGLPDELQQITVILNGLVDDLKSRLDRANKEIGLPENLADKLDKIDLQKLANTLVTLAMPQGRLSILLPWKSEWLKSTQGHEGLSLRRSSNLDQEWLTVVATTRANLARLESLQLTMNEPLDTLSSQPEDPWCKKAVKKIQEQIKRPDPQTPNKMDREVRVWFGYGDSSALNGSEVAVGLIDSFNESIPVPRVTTTAAFGFNAPSSRAPQTILLAVPPEPRQRLDHEVLLQIVRETRELAIARSVRLGDIPDEFHFLSPSMWLKTSGPLQMHLEAWPLFDIDDELVVR